MAIKFQRGKVWYVKYKDPSGKWVPISCGKNATKEDAENIRKMYDAREFNNRHNATIKLVTRPLKEAMLDFQINILPRSLTGRTKAHNTIRREKVVIDNVLRWFEDRNISRYDQVNGEILLKYFDYLEAENKAPKTRREERRILKRFYEWSIKEHYTIIDPTTEIINPKRSPGRPRFFSESELKDIFETANMPYQGMFKFLYLTGLRVGELGNLEIRDFIEPSKMILIRIMDGNKTKREETVPLNDAAIRVLKEQLEYNKRFETEDVARYCFINNLGLQIDNNNVYRALSRILKNKKIKDASPHTFRHTCASHLVIKGVSLYIVKEILRHASIKETEVYAHLSKEAVSTAIQILSV